MALPDTPGESRPDVGDDAVWTVPIERPPRGGEVWAGRPGLTSTKGERVTPLGGATRHFVPPLVGDRDRGESGDRRREEARKQTNEKARGDAQER